MTSLAGAVGLTRPVDELPERRVFDERSRALRLVDETPERAGANQLLGLVAGEHRVDQHPRSAARDETIDKLVDEAALEERLDNMLGTFGFERLPERDLNLLAVQCVREQALEQLAVEQRLRRAVADGPQRGGSKAPHCG